MTYDRGAPMTYDDAVLTIRGVLISTEVAALLDEQGRRQEVLGALDTIEFLMGGGSLEERTKRFERLQP